MPENTVIIIGAGLAGLSAGCYAQMNGYQTRILEHHSKPGGVVAGWRRNGFMMDGGIHYLMDFQPPRATHQLYAELGILPANKVQQMETYLRFIDEPSRNNITITRDLDRFGADLKALSPADTRIIDELISAAKAMRGLDMMGIGLAKPDEMAGWLDKLKMMWRMKGLLKYMGGKYARSVREFSADIKEPMLRRIIESIFLPDVPVFFITMLLACLADGQMGVLEEGSLKFARSLEDRYRGLGGQIEYSSTVTKIIVEGNRAIGVQLENGRQYTADTIISAADGYSTIFQMLDGKYTDQRIQDMYKSWKLFTPIMIVNFGVAREFKDEPGINIIALRSHSSSPNAFVAVSPGLERPAPEGIGAFDSPLKIGNRNINMLSLRIFNHSPHFAPAGKTVIQVMAETDWDYWHNLRVNNRLQYDSEKQRVAGEILERLEAYYPGISAQVEVTDVATPYTMWRYTHNYKGAFEGWMPSPETFRSRVRMTLPGLENFYMAGQWVMPGGGVPPCLYSGRHAVQMMCYMDKKEFAAAMPKS